MADVRYRPVRRDDLHALARVQSEAVRWLAKRSGRDISHISRRLEPSPAAIHLLRTDPGLFWLAEVRGRAVGFSAGTVRGDYWLLSALFVDPDAHGRGIGRELMRRCFEAGLARGVTTHAVVASSHASAQSLYARLGLAPRWPIFVMRGPHTRLLELPAPSANVRPLRRASPLLGKLDELDDAVRGGRRAADHGLWLSQPSIGCRTLEDGRDLLGYVYAHREFIGPVASRRPRLQLELLHAASQVHRRAEMGTVQLHVPGPNIVVLGALLDQGFQIDHANLFMSSRKFGRFDRYLPSGGTFL